MRSSGERKEVRETHKYATGFPPLEGVGAANQVMPLAAHLRSEFFKTVMILRPSEGTFLEKNRSNRG